MGYVFGQRIRELRRGVSCLVAFVMVCSLLCFNAPVAHASAPTLKVGYADCDGITVDDKGNHSGYAVDYLKELSKYTGWEYEFILYSWSDCMDALERGEIDLLPMVFHTPERADRFLYSNLFMRIGYTVIYTTPDKDIYYQDYAAFEGCRIGVAAETYFESSLNQHISDLDLNCEVVTFATDREVKEALHRGEIDLMVVSSFSSYPDLKIVDRFDMVTSYLVTNKENQELMDQINAAFPTWPADADGGHYPAP